MIGADQLSIDIDDEWGETAPFYLIVQGNVIVHASSKSQFFTI